MANLPQRRYMAERPVGDRDTPPPVTVNDAEAILQGVKAGLGKSLLPVAIADKESGLIRLTSGPPPLTRELWLMVHPELRNLTRISVVMDWLVSVVGEFLDGQSAGGE
jgi:DNA-binding transcriptional LysR family regulator